MPIHDWTRVDAGIFHHFHQSWIGAITAVLNRRLLPEDYYALAEQRGAGFEPDVLTLKTIGRDGPEKRHGASTPVSGPGNGHPGEAVTGGGLVTAEPRARVRAETDLEFYRRKQTVVAVRDADGDALVAVVEIVSRGNKSGRKVLEDFTREAAALLEHGIHLLILDLQPATARDPQGIHGVIWEEIAGEPYLAPPDEPLTLAAYESEAAVRAFVEPTRVGAVLVDMPLFLAWGRYVPIPLEETYQAAFDAVPRRWREVLGP